MQNVAADSWVVSPSAGGAKTDLGGLSNADTISSMPVIPIFSDGKT